MNRAHLAAFMAKTRGLADTLRLQPAEVVDLALRLAVEQAERAGITGPLLHSRLDDLRAVRTVEGNVGAAHE